MFIVVELIEALCHIHQMTGQNGRFIFIRCIQNDLRYAVNQLNQVIRTVGCDVLRIEIPLANPCHFLLGGIAEDAASSGMSVLNVRTGLTVEVQHLVPVKYIILDAVVGQLLENYGTDTDFLCHFVHIDSLRILLFHDFRSLLGIPRCPYVWTG